MGFVPRRCETEKCEGSHYCIPAHVAYSSSHFCWQMPTALFQVNRQIRQQALFVFYLWNRFSLKLSCPWSNLDYNWLAPRNFKNNPLYLLTPFPGCCFECLQHLEWCVDFSEIESLLPGGKNHGFWLEALDLLAQNTSPHQLTLIPDMSLETYQQRFCSYPPGEPSYKDPTKEKWGCYRGIIEPVAVRLRGLKDSLVRLSWPVQTAKVKVRDAMEVELRRAVMEKEYDSSKRGKMLTNSV